MVSKCHPPKSPKLGDYQVSQEVTTTWVFAIPISPGICGTERLPIKRVALKVLAVIWEIVVVRTQKAWLRL